MKINITMFIPSLSGGGAERIAINLANNLDKRKFNITLLVLNSQSSYYINSDVNVNILKSKRLIYVIPELVNYMKKQPPDLFISHMSLSNVVTLIAKKFARKEFSTLIIEHTTPSIKYNNDGAIYRQCIPILMRISYKFADSIVSVSKGVAKDLAQITRIPNKNIKVIYNPIVNDQVFNVANQPVDCSWLNNSNLKVIMGIGRLEKVKNFSLLIRAFLDVYKEDPNTRLIIFGEGSERENLEKYIHKLGLSEVVSLPGFVTNIYSYLSKASVFTLTSNYEGLPTVLIEALACATPVVSTDCPSGPREILSDGQFGILTPVKDHVSLTEAILKIIKKERVFEPEELIMRASEFSIDKAIEQYENVILSLVD